MSMSETPKPPEGGGGGREEEVLRDLDAQLRGSSTYDREDAGGIYVPPDAYLTSRRAAASPQLSAAQERAALSAIENPANSEVDHLLSGTRIVSVEAVQAPLADLDDLFSFGPSPVVVPPKHVSSSTATTAESPSATTVDDVGNYLEQELADRMQPPVLF
mmetsp:Transcript_26331/g.66207  ORF Transcript_26331/g.66207 Transcript_26331/m.66207 type:complete len:160 (-) Transcript_26331:51-530(-)